MRLKRSPRKFIQWCSDSFIARITPSWKRKIQKVCIFIPLLGFFVSFVNKRSRGGAIPAPVQEGN